MKNQFQHDSQMPTHLVQRIAESTNLVFSSSAAIRMRLIGSLACIALALSCAGCGSTEEPSGSNTSDSPPVETTAVKTVDATDIAVPVTPWDYNPYQVLVWLVSDDPEWNTARLSKETDLELAKDFRSIWRTQYADAPASVCSAVRRGMESLDFDGLSAPDPVIAVKRDHPEAIRVRFAKDLESRIHKVLITPSMADRLTQRGKAIGNEQLDGMRDLLSVIEGDANALMEKWADDETEALVLPRGMASTLKDPGAKILPTPVGELVVETMEQYDKVFIVQIQSKQMPGTVRAVEFDTLMRYFSPVRSVSYVNPRGLPQAIASAVTHAFAPVVRIDEAGTKRASGLVRAGGLIRDEASPAKIHAGQVLRPMIRKNDRNNRPIMLGPVDWAYLLVTEADDRKCKMDIHAGRVGGLKVRMNNRTFRVALRVQTPIESTQLRLHAKGKEDQPLIGYEIYERELDSKDMTFVGRTDWDGRLAIPKNEKPLRLLYVKNGGAVLARLPMVPGMLDRATADLTGDDLRLQAEAYVKGVQNSIIDLVAIRELLAARIRLRLEQNDLKRAKSLLDKLRDQPTNQIIADDLSRKQDQFLKLIGRNANQRKKIDNLFASTRDILTKFINGRLISELEAQVIQAEGGVSIDASNADSESDE